MSEALYTAQARDQLHRVKAAITARPGGTGDPRVQQDDLLALIDVIDRLITAIDDHTHQTAQRNGRGG